RRLLRIGFERERALGRFDDDHSPRRLREARKATAEHAENAERDFLCEPYDPRDCLPDHRFDSRATAITLAADCAKHGKQPQSTQSAQTFIFLAIPPISAVAFPRVIPSPPARRKPADNARGSRSRRNADRSACTRSGPRSRGRG